MSTIEKDKKLKPWLTNKIDLDDELKRLGLKKSDLKLGLKNRPVILDTVNNPVDRVHRTKLVDSLFVVHLFLAYCKVPGHRLIPSAT